MPAPMEQALANAIGGAGGGMGGPPMGQAGPPPGAGAAPPSDPIEMIIQMLQQGQIGPAIELLSQLRGSMSGAARPGGVDGTVAGM
jgi:hypothetical protein